MLARRLTTILPVMTLAEAIETLRIQSVAGLTGDRTVQASDLAGYPTLRTRGEEGA
jgi:predicted ATPase with chaperone activity